MLPYGLILLVAAIALAVHHVAITDAPRTSKRAVSIAAILAIIIWWNYWQWQGRVTGMVLQAMVCVYTLTYLRMTSRAQ
jgi:hypothetical protein